MNDADDISRLREAMRDVVGEEPTTADVEALLEGRLSTEEAQALGARSIDDGDLALQIRVAAELQRARAEELPGPNVVSPRGGWRRRAVVAAVFAVAASLLVFVLLKPPTLDDVDSSTIRAGVEPVATLVPSATLPKDAFVLEWTDNPSATTYDLYLTTKTLDPIHQALDLQRPRYTVPPSALADVASGTPLLWRVTAVTEEGRRINSPAFEVELE